MKKTFTLFALFIVAINFAQIGIGTATPHNSSILEINSNKKGFLPPRLNNAQRAVLDAKGTILGPANGLIIYNTDENCLQVNKGNKTNPDWTCIGNTTIPCNAVSFTATNSNAITVNTNTSIRLETTGHTPSANDLSWSWTITSQETGATTSVTPVGNNSNADFIADTPGNYQVRVTAENATEPSNCNSSSSLSSTYNITVTTPPATPCDAVSFNINNNQSTQTNTVLLLTTSNQSPSASNLNWSWAITSQVSGATTSIVPTGNNSRANFTANTPGNYTVTVTAENTSVPGSCAPTNRVRTFTITVAPSFVANVSLSGCNVSGSNNNYNVCAGNFNSVTATVNTGSATGSFIGPGSWSYNGTLLNYNTFRCPYTGKYTLYYDMYATVTGSGSARMPNVNQLDNGNSNEQAILNRFASFTCNAGQVPPQNSGGLNPVNQAGGTNGALKGSASSRFQNVRIEYNGPN